MLAVLPGALRPWLREASSDLDPPYHTGMPKHNTTRINYVTGAFAASGFVACSRVCCADSAEYKF